MIARAVYALASRRTATASLILVGLVLEAGR